MPPAPEHTHHIKIRSTQLEMNPAAASGRQGEDVEGKLRAAEEQLQQLEQQREALERQKREFIGAQAELTDKMSATVTRIDREVIDMRQEIEELEQCRSCLAAHLNKLEKINPDAWSRENMGAAIERAMAVAEHADDEFSQAAD